MDCLLQNDSLIEVFSTDVNITGTGTHSEASQQTPFNQFVRILTHDFTIFTSTRLGLIRIDDQERRSPI